MEFNSNIERHQFIEDNLRLVTSRVMKLNNSIFDEDLYQVGAEALIEATDRFNENRGVAFSTYATRWIDGRILQHKKYDTVIKPKRKQNNLQYKIVNSLDDLIGDSEISVEEIIGCDINAEQEALSNILVEAFMDTLSHKESIVLKLMLDELTQINISGIIGVSQSCVSRIKRCIADKYRHFNDTSIIENTKQLPL